MTKRAISCYLPLELHPKLKVAAGIAGIPVTTLVEQIITRWLTMNAEAIDAAADLFQRMPLRWG